MGKLMEENEKYQYTRQQSHTDTAKVYDITVLTHIIIVDSQTSWNAITMDRKHNLNFLVSLPIF